MSENSTTNQFENVNGIAAEAVLPFDDFATDDIPTPTRQRSVSSTKNTDNAGYGKLSEGIGVASADAASKQVAVPACHPERAKRVEGSAQSSAEGAHSSSHLAYRFVKRTFDIAFSACVIILLAVPVAILCVLIRAESSGSPIYRQRRVGWRDTPLDIFKLRTMVADADDVEKHFDTEQLEQWTRERKVDDDPRVTKIGRFLRRTSLDELPQFLNVFAGSMSVVGPRPVVVDELEAYGADTAEFLSMRPGITGWWQVSARNDATYADGSRQQMELYYVRNASAALDLRVFLGTFKAIFKRTGQ